MEVETAEWGAQTPQKCGMMGRVWLEKGGSMVFAMKFPYLGVFLAGFGQGDAKSLFVPYAGILQV